MVLGMLLANQDTEAHTGSQREESGEVNPRCRDAVPLFRDHFVRPSSIEKEAPDRPCSAFTKLEPTLLSCLSVLRPFSPFLGMVCVLPEYTAACRVHPIIGGERKEPERQARSRQGETTEDPRSLV